VAPCVFKHNKICDCQGEENHSGNSRVLEVLTKGEGLIFVNVWLSSISFIYKSKQSLKSYPPSAASVVPVAASPVFEKPLFAQCITTLRWQLRLKENCHRMFLLIYR